LKNTINEAQFIKDLNRPRGEGLLVNLTSRLHDGQIKALAPLYDPKISLVFTPSARKFGKSEMSLYAAWRHCGMHPGSMVYLIGPEKTHIADIYWDGQRAQKFLEEDSEKYIAKIKDRERMIIFKNGSVLKLMGSENWKAAQGLTPDLIIYDEFKHFHHKFHTEMAPNVAARGAKILIVGTQPQVGDRNKNEYEGMYEYCKQNPNTTAYAEYATFDNPIMHLPAQRKAIDEHIAQLRAAGDEATVQREYYSKIVPGGSRAIFPMFSRDRHVRRHEYIMAQIKGVEHQFEWWNIIDPSSTTYGGIFLAYHPKTKMLFCLDELYIKDRFKTSTKEVGPVIKDKMQELNSRLKPRDWYKVGDQAAALHLIDMQANFPDLSFMQSLKNNNNKDDMIMVLKDMLTEDLLIFSDRCINTIKEFEEYATNQDGQLVKNRHSKDHNIDNFCYFLHYVNYNIKEIYSARLDLPPEWSWFIKGFTMFGAEKTGELDDLIEQEYGEQHDDFDTF